MNFYRIFFILLLCRIGSLPAMTDRFWFNGEGMSISNGQMNPQIDKHIKLAITSKNEHDLSELLYCCAKVPDENMREYLQLAHRQQFGSSYYAYLFRYGISAASFSLGCYVLRHMFRPGAQVELLPQKTGAIEDLKLFALPLCVAALLSLGVGLAATNENHGDKLVKVLHDACTKDFKKITQ